MNKNRVAKGVKHEELEAIFALFCSVFVMTVFTLFLTYIAIKRIIKPLEILEKDLNHRTEENLKPIPVIGQYQHINFYQDIVLPLRDELNELVKSKAQQLIWHNSATSFYGDATLIRLLVRNLVENAYRYSSERSTIEINCYQIDQKIILEVKDEGTGIDESKREKLTHAFFRMDRKHDGIGLGLSIVNRIAKLHHGKFTLNNRTDGKQGATAQLELTS